MKANQLFTTGITEPKSQAKRKRLVSLLSKLRARGFRVLYKAGRYYA